MSSCPLTNDSGLPLIQWIQSFTDTCIYGNLQATSWVSQYLSIAIWIIAGTYQSYKLYKSKDISGFSESFLVCWIFGATLNTIGSILTGQMMFQIILAFYFLFSDCVLYFQYKYYEVRPWLMVETQIKEECQVLVAKDPNAEEFVEAAKHQRANSTSKGPVSESSPFFLHYSAPSSSAGPSSSSSAGPSSSSSARPSSSSQGYSTFTPAVVLGVAFNASPGSCAPIPSSASVSNSVITNATSSILSVDATQFFTLFSFLQLFIGTTASWASNCLFVVSRFPQIKRNFERKSCEGVSPLLFFAAVVGNLSYCFTIAAEWWSFTDRLEAVDFMMKEVPFLLGSIATTLADMFIFFQFYIYRNNDGVDYEMLTENCESLFVDINKL